MANFKDPNFEPKGNPHSRYRAGQVEIARKFEQEVAQRKIQVVEQPKRSVSAGGVVLDPVTAEMREKIEAERRAKKQTPVAAAPVSPEEAKQIVMILIEAFEQQHRDVFHAVPDASGKGYSKFNATQFHTIHPLSPFHRVKGSGDLDSREHGEVFPISAR